MKTHVQFFHMSTGYVEGTIPPVFRDDAKRLIPACGSDSFFYPDGRYSKARVIHEARQVAIRRGFLAFQIFTGSVLKPFPASNVITIEP